MKARANATQLIAATGALACLTHAAAQLRAPADTGLIDPLPMRSALTEAGQPPAPSLTLPTTARAALTPSQPAWESTVRSISLVELPNYSLTADRPRPHYALGFASDAMRNWMNDIGIDAGTCTAPIIRLRTRIESGEFRGTLWVHARCSLW
jgi:hypothetical protein